MKPFIYSAFVCSLILTACGERSVGTSRMNPVAPTAAAPAKSNAPISPLANPGQSATNTVAATGNLNPAHGQPGHRCDIAVGAPLPANSATSVQQALPAATTVPANIQGATAKINPAHGQPGHRCDVAVGAPLPADGASSVQQALPAATNVQPVPAVQPVAAGLNPAHGEPGHRCDIAVGAPLNSKPAGN